MLVCVWNAMDAAIAQITAQEWMDDYTVAVVSSPYVDNKAREGILEGWRRLILGGWRKTFKANDKEYLADGSELQRHNYMPLREVIDTIKNAFGRSIRD